MKKCKNYEQVSTRILQCFKLAIECADSVVAGETGCGNNIVGGIEGDAGIFAYFDGR